MFRSILFLVLLSVPALASAQQWQVAYQGGTYRWVNGCWKWYAAAPQYTTTHDNHAVTQTFVYNFTTPAQPYAQQGNTLFGLGTLPTIDPEASLERIYRILGRVGETLHQGIQDTTAATVTIYGAQADLADQESRKQLIQVLSNFLESTKGQQKVQAAASATVDPGQAAKLGSAQGVFSRHCGECHTGAKAKGGLDLSDISKLAPEQIQKAMQRMASTTKERMPPAPAPAVPADEVMVVLRAALGVE